jgi:hypothetical protein
LPATVRSISVKNLTAGDLDIDVFGWLENKTLPDTQKAIKILKELTI